MIDEFSFVCECEKCQKNYRKWKKAYEAQQKQLRGDQMSGDHNMYASGSGDGQRSGWRKRTIQEMAREAGLLPLLDEDCFQVMGTKNFDATKRVLEAFAALVREDERDACAKVCESLWRIDGQLTADEFAAEIRARGDKHD